MKLKRFFILMGCILFATMITLISVSGQNNTLFSTWNHFKVYEAALCCDPIKEFPVTVQDQFNKETRKAQVIGLSYFANPVSKNKEKIVDPYYHLTWYKIKIKEITVKRKVIIENQFGKQEWILGNAVYLLVPTEKIEKGSSFPKEANHFLCYEVLEAKTLELKVTLKDQFDLSTMKPPTTILGKPLYFCNPVMKNKEPIMNPKYHLAVYSINLPNGLRTVQIKNQFGGFKLCVGNAAMLCVPTIKHEFGVIK
jgi:hypothetical protein